MEKQEFAELIVSEQAFMHRVAAYYVTNADDRRDLCQDVTCKLLKYHDKFEKDTNIKGWIHSAVKNMFLTQQRKKRISQVEVPLWQQENISSSYKTEGLVTAWELKEILEPKKQDPTYKCFFLYAKGFKYEEIAEMLGYPLGTVKSKIFLNRRDLRECLGAHYRPDLGDNIGTYNILEAV